MTSFTLHINVDSCGYNLRAVVTCRGQGYSFSSYGNDNSDFSGTSEAGCGVLQAIPPYGYQIDDGGPIIPVGQ